MPNVSEDVCQGCSRNTSSPDIGQAQGDRHDKTKLKESDEYIPVQENAHVNPELVHRWKTDKGIMSLATTGDLVLAGTEDGDILVFNHSSYQLQCTLTGHQGNVFCLILAFNDQYLISGSSDSLVKIWNLENFDLVCTVYSVYDIGDIFSVAWSSSFDRFFFGAQDTSIQWMDFHGIDEEELLLKSSDPSGLPSRRFSKFFDSRGPGGHLAPQQTNTTAVVFSDDENDLNEVLLEVPPTNVVKFAHNGYVYCMLCYTTGDDKEILVSGSGDGTVKLWSIGLHYLSLLHTFQSDNSILSMTKSFPFCFCGTSDGQVEMYDIETRQLLRVDKSAELDNDITSLSAKGDLIFRCIGNVVQNWDTRSYNRSGWIAQEKGLILSSTLVNDRLITGGTDGCVAIWDISGIYHTLHWIEEDSVVALDDDQMIKTLRNFISYKTVAGHGGKYVNDCRRCATFLLSLIKHFGGEANLLPVGDFKNPIVLGKFEGNGANRSRILFYGHYDVIIANETGTWSTNPYDLTAQNGYLYGRGVSDNKGPILAAIFAVAQLFQDGELENDVVFVIEGEEECGSGGFKEAISKQLDVIGKVDWIILSNSYWINDSIPCLTYGLRGVISMSLTVKSQLPDLHSGVHGGLHREPTFDMINLLSTLTCSNTGRIVIPKFYESVQQVTPEETQLYDTVVKTCKDLENESSSQLMARWRFPSLTLHGIDVSGPGNTTVIPASSTARVSMRIVPDQNIEEIKDMVLKYLQSQFDKFNSANELAVKFSQEAEPWLGDPMNPAFQLLKQALKQEWGVEPLLIREGGSIPVIRWLEKLFGASAVQLPCGQSSDGAHLDNERLRILNFTKARKILRHAFKELKPNNRP